jgi:hypothetical protein
MFFKYLLSFQMRPHYLQVFKALMELANDSSAMKKAIAPLHQNSLFIFCCETAWLVKQHAGPSRATK